MKWIRAAMGALLIAGSANAWDVTENTVWLQGSIQGRFSDAFSVKLTEQLRYFNHETFNYYRHTEFGLNWAFSKAWGLEPAYRHIQARTRDSEWETRPTWGLNLRNKAPIYALSLKTRLRLFHTELDDTRNLTDFRPMLTLEPSKGWTGWNLKPFLADELMYNFEERGIYRNRLGAGFSFSPYDPISFKGFAVQEITRIGVANNWKERYNLGAAVALKF